MKRNVTHLAEITKLIDQGALFVVNHSGGKDSQAMYAQVRALVPRGQLVVIHSVLEGAEWTGVQEHIAATVDVPVVEVRAERTFMEMVLERGYWPTPKYRECTSYLKRGPIEKAIRAICKERGATTVVNCTGLRAAESPNRASLETLELNTKNTIRARTWLDWLPIHHYTTEQVFDTIREAGQKPHYAYGLGMTRLSCVFCIMGSDADLLTAARLHPELVAEYVQVEKVIGHTFKAPTKRLGARTLDQVIRDLEAKEAKELARVEDWAEGLVQEIVESGEPAWFANCGPVSLF